MSICLRREQFPTINHNKPLQLARLTSQCSVQRLSVVASLAVLSETNRRKLGKWLCKVIEQRVVIVSKNLIKDESLFSLMKKRTFKYIFGEATCKHKAIKPTRQCIKINLI